MKPQSAHEKRLERETNAIRKTYKQPSLLIYGHINQLTQSGSTGSGENSGMDIMLGKRA